MLEYNSQNVKNIIQAMFSKLCSTQWDIKCYNTPHLPSNLRPPPQRSWRKSPNWAHADSSELVISYLHNTQQIQQANIHDFSKVRTNNPSNQAASEQLLRPQATAIGSL